MFKKTLWLTMALLCGATAHARLKKEITMLIVPRDQKTIQIAQDIAGAYPVLLVVYRQAGDGTDLHAWNGEGWVPVSTEDYTNGTFFATAPAQAILVQPGRVSVPDMLIPPGTWCRSGSRLLSTDPRVLIHLLGRHFDFPYRHWKKMADRYGYTLEQVNPALLNVHWWHYRGDELLTGRAQGDAQADLDLWHTLDITLAAAEEPAAIEEVPAPPAEEAVAAEAEQEAEPPAEEPVPSVKSAEQPPAPEAVPAEAEEAVKDTPEAPAVPAEPAEAAAVSAVEADPFSEGDIPTAEVILPGTPD